MSCYDAGCASDSGVAYGDKMSDTGWGRFFMTLLGCTILNAGIALAGGVRITRLFTAAELIILGAVIATSAITDRF